jgi:hypothetical protein
MEDYGVQLYSLKITFTLTSMYRLQQTVRTLKIKIARQTFFRHLFNIFTAVLNCKQATASVSLDSTVMRHLTTGIRSEKCVVRRFRRCAKVI